MVVRMPDRAKPIQILLVEDDPASARLTQDALRDAHIVNRIHLAKDGDEALKVLRREGPYTNVPRPDLILLDLNLPKMDGRELLIEIRKDEQLTDIPVIVLSVSGNPDDISASYKQHVAGYIRKPADPDEYFHAIRCVKELWFNVVTLPKAAAV
jgi:CheY-like chemotaxis protein